MPESEGRPAIGYVVSTWPRLSQTFVLTEVLALERLGLRLRIFSGKDPGDEPVHAEVAQVRADVTYLSFRRHWKPSLRANVHLASALPGRYARTLLAAIRFALRYRRWGVIRRFFQAGYLADVLRRDPVSHLHAHFATAPALVAMFTHELIGVPYTFTAHARDIYVDTHPALLRAQMVRAKAVVTVCEYNRRYLAGLLGPQSQGKVRCIYNGLDLRPFRCAPPTTTDTDTGPPLILSVGRLIEKKGIGDVIAAADILRERGRSFQVEIIGTGPLGPSVAADVKRRGLEDRVQLRGAQPLDVIRLAYRRATVFALPSVVAADGDRDGVPTVLMEAMASGVAVVSTCVSGIPELITAGQDGLLVAPRCPAALADALDVLLSDPELRARLARAARRKIEECFAIDRSAAHLLALFQQGGDG